MSNIFTSLKAAARGFASTYQPARYTAAGIQVRCTHCQGEVFQEREALINTTGATFAKVDWLNQSGRALVCENCGLIHWFAKQPQQHCA